MTPGNNDKFVCDAHRFYNCLRELSKDEVWVGNTDIRKGLELPEHLRKVSSARLGEQAYDINGIPIERDYCRPIIISKKDEAKYNQIMEERYRQANAWRK